MKLKDIPAYMGITAAHLAEICGVSPQAFNNYTSGRRGKKSDFVSTVLEVANLNQEQIIFPDVFDHPAGEDETHAAYWVNIAIEALKQAKLLAHDPDDIDSIDEVTKKLFTIINEKLR